jgi:hypothetical protein
LTWYFAEYVKTAQNGGFFYVFDWMNNYKTAPVLQGKTGVNEETKKVRAMYLEGLITLDQMIQINGEIFKREKRNNRKKLNDARK